MSGFYTWLNNILCVIITGGGGGGGGGRTGDTSPGSHEAAFIFPLSAASYAVSLSFAFYIALSRLSEGTRG